MTVDVSNLKELAERATKGPWEADHAVDRNTCVERRAIYARPSPYHVLEIVEGKAGPELGGECIPDEANWKYIAAANPSAILSLLSRLENAEKALRFYASGSHMLGMDDWDTVSGEPTNWVFPEDELETGRPEGVETGRIASEYFASVSGERREEG